MAKFTGVFLNNQAAKLYYLADDTATQYTELGAGSDFTGPRWTGSVGQVAPYENAGLQVDVPQTRRFEVSGTITLKHGVAKPSFKMHDFIYFIKKYSDGTGKRVYVLLTALDEGSNSPNGTPQYTFTGTGQVEPDDIAAADLADWLSLDLPA
jgi:hypothetical protein